LVFTYFTLCIFVCLINLDGIDFETNQKRHFFYDEYKNSSKFSKKKQIIEKIKENKWSKIY